MPGFYLLYNLHLVLRADILPVTHPNTALTPPRGAIPPLHTQTTDNTNLYPRNNHAPCSPPPTVPPGRRNNGDADVTPRGVSTEGRRTTTDDASTTAAATAPLAMSELGGGGSDGTVRGGQMFGHLSGVGAGGALAGSGGGYGYGSREEEAGGGGGGGGNFAALSRVDSSASKNELVFGLDMAGVRKREGGEKGFENTLGTTRV